MARTFGKRSLDNLAGVHPLMVKLVNNVLQASPSDFTVICGYRDKAGQDAAVAAKTTKVSFPNSAHNQSHPTTGEPRSVAIDVIPYPFTNWEDKAMLTAWKAIADTFEKEAAKLGIKIRWGGDLNRDGDKTKTDAWDKPHFELHPWRDYAKKA